MTRRTGWVWHETFMWHDTGTGAGPLPAGGWLEPMEHIESPVAKRRFANLVAASGLLHQLIPVTPRPATREELSTVHTTRYVDSIKFQADSGRGDAGDGSSPFGRSSFDIASLAAGGAIVAVEAVMAGEIDNAYVLSRPAGHHAMTDTGWGFCIFNNAAIAARAAQRAGARRVAIVDWDVHHGNGAEEIFATDPSVLTISIHQDGAFPPGSGDVRSNGIDAGAGTNLNIALPPGAGNPVYEAAMSQVVVPALERFKPDFIVVASGLDANGWDPLARQMLHSEGFRSITRYIRQAAERLCAGRLVLTHEGGYQPAVAPFCGHAIVEELSGIRTDVVDPFVPAIEAYGQRVWPHHMAAIERSAALVDRVPRPHVEKI